MTIQTVQISNTFNEFRETTNLVIDEVNKLGDGTGNLVIDTITANTYVGVSSDLTVAGNTGSDVISLTTDTLNIVGSNGITTSVASNTVSVNLGSSLSLANLALTSGAANSVVYLDASKNLTANSNLYFNGSLLSLIGSMTVNSSSGFTFALLGNDSFSNTAYISGYNFASGGHQLAFLTGDTERMRLTTTGLGIGMTSPAVKLDVAGGIRLRGSTTGYVGFQAASSGTNQTYTLPSSDGLNGQVLQTNGVGSLSWVNQTAGGGGGGGGSGTSTERTAFTATGGQTTFSVNYVVGQVDVYMNGSKLVANNDFTATDGTSIVLAAGATAGDVVEAVTYTSQWITSGSNLYYANGSIGVGTTNPASRLHVASANTAFAVGTIRLDGANATGVIDAPTTINAITGGGAGNGGSQLYFETRAENGSLTERLRINQNGWVGINTDSPVTRLDVSGSLRARGNFFVYDTGDRLNIFPQSAGNGANIVASNVDNTTYSRLTLDGAPIVVNYAGAEAARFTATGMGIGITSPAAKLHLNSSTSNSVSFIAGDISYTASQVNIGVGVISPGRPFVGTNTNTNPLEIGTRAAVETIFVTDSTEKMRLDAIGNFGIGTSNPQSRLVVSKNSSNTLPTPVVNTNFEVHGEDGAPNRIFYYAYGGAGGTANAPTFTFRRSNGTAASPTGVVTNDALGVFGAQGHDGSNWTLNRASILFYAANTWTTTSTPTYIQFITTPNGSNTPSVNMMLSDAGTLGVNTATPNSSYKLDVNGNALVAGNFNVGGTGTGADGISINPSVNYSVAEGSGTSYTNLFRQATSGATVLANGYKYSANTNAFASSVGTSWAKAAIGINSGSVIFYTDAATTIANGTDVTPSERVRITSTGNVGIGNTTPVAKLDVNGNQAINIVSVAALDIDCSQGNYFIKTINGASTFTFSNAPASRAYGFTLELTHTSGTVTWPTTVRWPGNTAPTLGTGNTHMFTFMTDDAGSRWRGSSLVNYQN